MPRTKNVSAPGGGDDEDPRRPFRQVKGKTVYLEQQEGHKKRRTDRAARAAAAEAAAAAQVELGDQPQTPSDQITYQWSLGYQLRGTLQQVTYSAHVFRSRFSEPRCLLI